MAGGGVEEGLPKKKKKKLTMASGFRHRKACGGESEMQIQESNTGQRELPCAKFGSNL